MELARKGGDPAPDAAPGDAIQDMMKKMYDEGTPEVRKMLGEAMLKQREDQAKGIDSTRAPLPGSSAFGGGGGGGFGGGGGGLGFGDEELDGLM